jgi:hypothetical protein
MNDKVQNSQPGEGDPRFTWGVIIAVLDVLEAAGYRKADDQHTGRAIGLLGDVAEIYAGERDEAAGSGVKNLTPPVSDAPLNPGDVVLTSAQLSTVLDALDVAAEYKRDSAANCPDCDADPELCGTCEWRLGRAGEYDALAARLAEAQR